MRRVPLVVAFLLVALVLLLALFLKALLGNLQMEAYSDRLVDSCR